VLRTHVRPLRGAAPGQSEACARGDPPTVSRSPFTRGRSFSIYLYLSALRFSQDDLVDTVLEMQEKGCAFKIEGFQLIYGAFHSHSAQARQAPRDGTRYNTIYFIFAKVNFKALRFKFILDKVFKLLRENVSTTHMQHTAPQHKITAQKPAFSCSFFGFSCFDCVSVTSVSSSALFVCTAAET